MNPKVTVIVPTLNVASYIRECMDSILNQTLKEIEILVIDAYSTDGTYDILKRYEAGDERVQILEDRKKSTGYAKNFGIEKASAPYVVFVESDDYIETDMIEKLYDKAEETDAEIVKGGFDTFIGNGKEKFVFPKTVSRYSEDYEKILKPSEHLRCFRWIMFEWLGIYRKSFLEKYHICHNETPGAAYQDIGFWFLSFSYASKVYLMKDIYYHYRCDNPNASVKNNHKVFQTCGEYDYIRNILQSNKKIWETICPAFYREFYQSNEVVYNRLDDKLKPLLSNEMHDILNTARKEGVLDESLFEGNDRERLEWLLDSAKMFDELYKSWKQNQNRLLEKLKETCGMFPYIIIFGAGSYGANLHYILHKEKIWVSAYADNDRARQKKMQNGIKICSIEQCEKDFPKGIYLIASKHFGKEISIGLQKSGVKKSRIRICDVPSTVGNLI